MSFSSAMSDRMVTESLKDDFWNFSVMPNKQTTNKPKQAGGGDDGRKC